MRIEYEENEERKMSVDLLLLVGGGIFLLIGAILAVVCCARYPVAEEPPVPLAVGAIIACLLSILTGGSMALIFLCKITTNR